LKQHDIFTWFKMKLYSKKSSVIDCAFFIYVFQHAIYPKFILKENSKYE